MENNCILCSYQKECSDNTLILYTATPILQEIVAAHLRDSGFSFNLQDELFNLTGNPAAAVQSLRERLSDAERADIRVSSHRGAALLAAPTLDSYGLKLDTSWFEEALVNDRFTSFFQPIVDTRNSSVFAHECLIRLFADRPYNGGEIIDAAMSRGSIHLFDSYARRLSIRMAGPQFVPGAKVFINFMPSSIYDPAFCMASTMEEMRKTDLQPSDIVFEVVESDKITDVKHLEKICEYYRKAGFSFALDDVGTGSNSIQMVCDLKPNYIKIDKSLISKVSQPMYLTAVQKLSEFAHQFGVQVIAEGIEDRNTLEILQQLDIHLMQGYYFAKPAATMHSNANSLSQILNQTNYAKLPVLDHA